MKFQNFRTLACTGHKIWHASKSVKKGRMHAQPESNMAPQILLSWGHKYNRIAFYLKNMPFLCREKSSPYIIKINSL